MIANPSGRCSPHSRKARRRQWLPYKKPPIGECSLLSITRRDEFKRFPFVVTFLALYDNSGWFQVDVTAKELLYWRLFRREVARQTGGLLLEPREGWENALQRCLNKEDAE